MNLGRKSLGKWLCSVIERSMGSSFSLQLSSKIVLLFRTWQCEKQKKVSILLNADKMVVIDKSVQFPCVNVLLNPELK